MLDQLWQCAARYIRWFDYLVVNFGVRTPSAGQCPDTDTVHATHNTFLCTTRKVMLAGFSLQLPCIIARHHSPTHRYKHSSCIVHNVLQPREAHYIHTAIVCYIFHNSMFSSRKRLHMSGRRSVGWEIPRKQSTLENRRELWDYISRVGAFCLLVNVLWFCTSLSYFILCKLSVVISSWSFHAWGVLYKDYIISCVGERLHDGISATQ